MSRHGVAMLAALALCAGTTAAQTPVAGHYPPGQSGIRGASTPPVGWGYTNFSRFFTNLEAHDAGGAGVAETDELRFANISMITWTTPWNVGPMTFGALIGIPFATGNLNPSSEELESSDLGLGDILITPLSLYGKSDAFDYQFQLTYWSSTGRFTPGSHDNRGSGFPALVYSIGGAAYVGNERSVNLSAVARIEQNFEQDGTGITPGDDVVVDWGIGKTFRAAHPIEAGISGFATWQMNEQSGAASGADTSRYRYYGVGPEGSIGVSERWTLKLRAHLEFGARNAVEGNNLWLIAHCKL